LLKKRTNKLCMWLERLALDLDVQRITPATNHCTAFV